MPGPPPDSFIAYKNIYFGTGVSGNETIPERANFLTIEVMAPGGNGGTANALWGGGGGSGAGASDKLFILGASDAGRQIFYQVGGRSGENSFVTGSLEIEGSVSILCSSGINGLNGVDGGAGGSPGGNGYGGDNNYTGVVGEPGVFVGDGGFGGVRGYVPVSYDVYPYVSASPEQGEGGSGGSTDIMPGEIAKSGFISFKFS